METSEDAMVTADLYGRAYYASLIDTQFLFCTEIPWKNAIQVCKIAPTPKQKKKQKQKTRENTEHINFAVVWKKSRLTGFYQQNAKRTHS